MEKIGLMKLEVGEIFRSTEESTYFDATFTMWDRHCVVVDEGVCVLQIYRRGGSGERFRFLHFLENRNDKLSSLDLDNLPFDVEVEGLDEDFG